MIIIKCYGVDPYVAGAYSKKYLPLVKERFNLEDDFLVICPDDYIFHDGVEQTSWQALLEVMISPKYRAIEKDLAHALISYFQVDVVNTRLFFSYLEEEAVYKLENKDYPPFVVDDGREEEDEIEPYTADVFEEFEERARETGHSLEHDEDGHHHKHHDDDFN